MKPISAIRGRTVVSSENHTQHRHAACRQQDVKCTSNITLRCVHETTVAVGKYYILLLLCVCVCVCVCVGGCGCECGCGCKGSGMCFRACNLTNPECNAPPYCHLQPYFLILSHKRQDFRGKKKVTANRPTYIPGRTADNVTFTLTLRDGCLRIKNISVFSALSKIGEQREKR